MTKEKCLKLFYEFLVKNGVLFKYLENISTNNFTTIDSVFELCYKQSPSADCKQAAYGLINNGFTWQETKQRHTFWRILDNKWGMILENYKDE